jgi:hypothetical protein
MEPPQGLDEAVMDKIIDLLLVAQQLPGIASQRRNAGFDPSEHAIHCRLVS